MRRARGKRAAMTKAMTTGGSSAGLGTRMATKMRTTRTTASVGNAGTSDMMRKRTKGVGTLRTDIIGAHSESVSSLGRSPPSSLLAPEGSCSCSP